MYYIVHAVRTKFCKERCLMHAYMSIINTHMRQFWQPYQKYKTDLLLPQAMKCIKRKKKSHTEAFLEENKLQSRWNYLFPFDLCHFWFQWGSKFFHNWPLKTKRSWEDMKERFELNLYNLMKTEICSPRLISSEN